MEAGWGARGRTGTATSPPAPAVSSDGPDEVLEPEDVDHVISTCVQIVLLGLLILVGAVLVAVYWEIL
jgi:hypothetical protein